VASKASKTGGKRRREKKQRKRIEDAVQYALAHAARVEILILLNEASYTVAELSELTEIPISNVSNHIRRMYEDGAIEVADTEERRGTNVFWYRAVKIPYYSQEEAEDLTWMERHVTAGLVAQSGTAEVMAALRKGNLADPRTILSWDWYNVDAQGRDKFDAENHRHLERLRQIECESINRCAKSKEETTPILVSLFAFVRARKPRRPRSQSCDPNQQTD
jgi:DNA-binding transcriptional ArsR family regulator